MKLQDLTDGQKRCMNRYLVRAQTSLEGARRVMKNTPKTDVPIMLEEALSNLGRFHHFSEILGLSLPQEYHQILDNYLKLKSAA